MRESPNKKNQSKAEVGFVSHDIRVAFEGDASEEGAIG